MIVGNKHNQPKARPKDNEKKKTKTDKIYTPHCKRKTTTTTQLSVTDHNQKPIHNKHTTHYLITVKKKTLLVLFYDCFKKVGRYSRN